jgi:hypothetical protein
MYVYCFARLQQQAHPAESGEPRIIHTSATLRVMLGTMADVWAAATGQACPRLWQLYCTTPHASTYGDALHAGRPAYMNSPLGAPGGLGGSLLVQLCTEGAQLASSRNTWFPGSVWNCSTKYSMLAMHTCCL